MDPYMQAKNVHTGRCRWPPLKGEEDCDQKVYFCSSKISSKKLENHIEKVQEER